jgi:hypothetical protein
MDTQAIQVIEQDGRGFIELAEAHVVQDQETADGANEILVRITAGLKEIEKKRKSFTQPLNQSLKEINATFKGITEPIMAAKNTLSSRLMSWRVAEQRRIREEQEKAQREEERRRKIQEAHAAKGHQVKEEITPVEKPMPFSVQDTTKTRSQWTYEIIEEGMIPREYLSVNSAAITRAVRAGVRDIPGVKIYQKEVPVYA